MSDDNSTASNDQLQEFVAFYWTVHRLVAKAERYDPEQRLSIPTIVEFRAAFTHLMRVHAAQFHLFGPEHIKSSGYTVEEYCAVNLWKALGRLYRAGYDAFEAIAVMLELRINEMVDAYSQQTLYAVVPEAAERIFRESEAALNRIDSIKTRKDVENEQSELALFKEFDAAVGQLESVQNILRDNMPAFEKYEAERREKSRKDKAVRATTDLAGGILMLRHPQNPRMNHYPAEQSIPFYLQELEQKVIEGAGRIGDDKALQQACVKGSPLFHT